MRFSTGFRLKSKQWINSVNEQNLNRDTTYTDDDLAGPGLDEQKRKLITV